MDCVGYLAPVATAADDSAESADQTLSLADQAKADFATRERLLRWIEKNELERRKTQRMQLYQALACLG